jgi:hypothetical protein
MSDEKQPGYPNLKRTRGPGRPKGSVNKVTATAKENIIAVFSRIGGEAAMAKWALENLTEFYKIYARLIPTEVTGKDGRPLVSPVINVVIGEAINSGNQPVSASETGDSVPHTSH